MAFKFSTGLRKHQIYDGSIKDALEDCVIRLYSGTVPDSPNSQLGVGNNLLCEINASGEAVRFQPFSASNPTVLTKDLSQSWQGEVLEGGTVTFFRLCKQGDTGSESNSDIRIQGTVGGPSHDLIISNSELVEGAIQRIEYFSMTMVEFS